jgi:hypothetical protein
MLSPHFKVPGVSISDVKKYTKYSDVLGACKEAGIELMRLSKTHYAPLSVQQIYSLLRVIRKRQGAHFTKSIRYTKK